MLFHLSLLARPLAVASITVFALTAHADHHGGGDPTGTWTWSRPGRDGGPDVTTTLKLKAEGEKLTGTITGRENSESEISKGTVKAGAISFEVTREFNGNSFTIKYAGKVEGDKLAGTITFNRNGEDQSREWTASRAVAKDAGATGTWKSVITRGDGSTMELFTSLKVDGEKVTGSVKVNEFEIPLTGTFVAGKLKYKSEFERDGQTFTSTFEGDIKGDKLTGKSTTNFGGEERVRDVDATRVKE